MVGSVHESVRSRPKACAVKYFHAFFPSFTYQYCNMQFKIDSTNSIKHELLLKIVQISLLPLYYYSFRVF